MHILRNVLRIKGKKPPYKKESVLEEVALEFQLDLKIWGEILAAKNKKIKLSQFDIEELFADFVNELGKIVNAVDTF